MNNMKHFNLIILILLVSSCNNNKSTIESEIDCLAKQFTHKELQQIKNERLEVITPRYEKRIKEYIRRKKNDINFKNTMDSINPTELVQARFLLIGLKENLNLKPYDTHKISSIYYNAFREDNIPDFSEFE